MVGITVAIVLLSSLTGIDVGFHHAAQIHNVTHLEKRTSIMEVEKKKIDCRKATYKTVTLVDFVYTHKCFPAGWEKFLAKEKVKNVIKEMSPYLSKDAQNRQIEPPMPFMFRAFTVPRDHVKVVIIGQDPVPEANQATGLAFSLKPTKDPRNGVPTVFNMLVELKLEGMNVDLSNGDLTPWMKEGVLLLNAALTVRQGPSSHMARSHQDLWNDFTRLLIHHISEKGQPTAWILWGNEAKALSKVHHLIDTKRHYIKAGGHPSTSGKNACIRFFGRNYFKCANQFLVKKNRGAVNWSLPPRPGLFGQQPGDCDANGL
ncbi:hypothetical protein ACROYT_G044483 [Oculina patagonica]